MTRFECIMLIDDNKVDNFFHERVIKKNDISENIIIKESGEEALLYLNEKNSLKPELIFLDINMPGMNGWEFILEYIKQNLHLATNKCNIVLLINEYQLLENDTLAFAKANNVCIELRNKPVTCEVLSDIVISNNS